MSTHHNTVAMFSGSAVERPSATRQAVNRQCRHSDCLVRACCLQKKDLFMPSKILKRDGCIETWSTKRIGMAIFKALKGSGIKDPILADRLAGKVEQKLLDMDVDIPEQEQVQDLVQQVLMEARLYKVAERYIIYREKRRELRSQNDAYLDIASVTESYLDNIDWRVSENSNMVHSFQGLILHMAGSVQARYMLEKYPEEVRMAHTHGYFHIHDLSFGLAGLLLGLEP